MIGRYSRPDEEDQIEEQLVQYFAASSHKPRVGRRTAAAAVAIHLSLANIANGHPIAPYGSDDDGQAAISLLSRDDSKMKHVFEQYSAIAHQCVDAGILSKPEILFHAFQGFT